MQQELPDHPQGIYQVSTLENADAVAFAFINNGDPVKYPYKYFDIEEDEVRIQITYTGLCQSDAMTVRQKWGPWYVMTQYVSALPACPGHEVVGYVTKAGPKVERLKLGDRVGCNPLRNSCGKCALCKKGDNQLCGDREFLYVPYFGGYSTHIQLKEKSVFKLPAGTLL
jgi:D-arabinose 1-dehydrogenase-like Zn-dependent alcohol dehydrogenase